MQGLLLGLVGGGAVGLATIIGATPMMSSVSVIQDLLKRIKFDFFLGLMLTATFLGLLIPAFQENNHHPFIYIFMAMITGILFVQATKIGFQLLMKKMNQEKSKDDMRAIVFVLAIVIQNIPEGLAAGASMTIPNFMQALSLLGVIVIQDLTEGVTTGLSLLSLGLTKRNAFIGVALTGIFEAFFGILGGYLSSTILGIMPLILAFAGGAMLSVTLGEVLEKIKETNFKFLYNTNFISGILFMTLINRIHS